MKFIKFTTKVTKANTSSQTLRTSIPKPIVQLMDLREKDFLEWSVSFENERILICISKKEKEEDF